MIDRQVKTFKTQIIKRTFKLDLLTYKLRSKNTLTYTRTDIAMLKTKISLVKEL